MEQGHFLQLFRFLQYSARHASTIFNTCWFVLKVLEESQLDAAPPIIMQTLKSFKFNQVMSHYNVNPQLHKDFNMCATPQHINWLEKTSKEK